MNRLREKTIATLLIAMFAISIFAISAYAIEGTYLTASGTAGTEDRIVITMPVGFTLGELDTISWEEYLVAGYAPHVDVFIDADADGNYDDALVFEYAYNDAPEHLNLGSPSYFGCLTDAWYSTFSDDGNGPTSITDTAKAWPTTGVPGGEGHQLYTLAEWKAGKTPTESGILINGDSIVQKLEIEVDNWVVDTEAYVKNVLVNGHSSFNTASMTVYVDAFIPTISIIVSPPNLDYGTLKRGESTTRNIEIANNGDVHLSVTASVIETVPFYDLYLTLNSESVSGWSDTIDLSEPVATITFGSTLSIPSDFSSASTYTGTLVFWIEETEPF